MPTANVNGKASKGATIDKDSEHRQRSAIASYAKRNGFIVGEFYDVAVSGADAIEEPSRLL